MLFCSLGLGLLAKVSWGLHLSSNYCMCCCGPRRAGRGQSLAGVAFGRPKESVNKWCLSSQPLAMWPGVPGRLLQGVPGRQRKVVFSRAFTCYVVHASGKCQLSVHFWSLAHKSKHCQRFTNAKLATHTEMLVCFLDYS